MLFSEICNLIVLGAVHPASGRNTRLRTYLTPVSTEPFSQPFAGAQNAAANGYAPRNA